MPPVNVAVTLFAAFIVTEQVVELPLQAPPQLVKLAPLSGVAVSVTVAPEVWFTVHVVSPEPHVIPPPVTVPLPVTETPSGNWDAVPEEPLNEAVTLFAELIVTVQLSAVPAHAPPQPLKLAPELGWAVRVTVVPADTSALQLDPPAEVHEMLDPATVPFPVTETVRANVVADVVKVAVTSRSSLIVTVQVRPLPLQAPPQPENVEPLSGSSSSVIVESVVTIQLQSVSEASEPQSMSPPETLPPVGCVTDSVFVPTETEVNVAVTSF
jgi:hypothetical protein